MKSPLVYQNRNGVPVVIAKNNSKWEMWFVREDKENNRVVIWLEKKGKELSIPRDWVQ